MIYIAGPLFTEADIVQRKYEGASIRSVVARAHKDTKKAEQLVFNPIESPVNFKDMKPTAAMIFKADYDVIKQAGYFFFDISTLDTGVFVELGQVLQRIESGDNHVKVYPVMSDIRVPQAGNYEGRHVPVGNNQYMVGALDHYGIEIFSSFSDALEKFMQDYHV